MTSNLDQESWDKKIIGHGGSILQSWAWGEFQRDLGFNVNRLHTNNAAASVLTIALPMNKKYLYLPRGPVGEAQEVLSDLKDLSADHSIVFARLEPQKTMNLPRAIKETQPTHNWLLELSKTEEQLLIDMKPKHRYNINLAGRKGVVVREGKQEDLIELYKLLLETATRNRFRLHPQDYYWKAWDHLYPKHMKVLLAEYQGQILSGMILTSFGDTATYLHGGSSQVMKDAMAPYLLHWEAIKMMKNQGIRFYDFGGIAPSNEPNHNWAGITRFKKGFGGFEQVSPGAFDLVFSPVWYNVYKQARLVRNLIRK